MLGALRELPRELVGGFRVLRDRVLELPLPPEVRLWEPDEEVEVLLLRDPDGEDVRVAMVRP